MGVKVKLEEMVHGKMKFYRRVLEIVRHPRFLEAFQRAPRIEQDLLVSAINYESEPELRNFLAKAKELGECNITELRYLAGEANIKGYLKLSAENLREEIANATAV